MAGAQVIHLLMTAALLASPSRLQISTARGVSTIALVQVRGDGPLISLNALARTLGGTVQRTEPWVTLQLPAGRFRFLSGTPLVQDGVTLSALPAASRARGDSLLIPLAFVAEILAAPGRQAWSYVAATATLTEGAAAPPIPMRDSRTTVGNEERKVNPFGLRPGHLVTIDPGHGGYDTGNPGKFFPRGLTEKDVTLAVGKLVADELTKKGVQVTMTRTTDTLINLTQRAPKYCQRTCDLFVSIHVNSLNPRPGYTDVRGFGTYFLSEARTEDAARVQRMENESVRFDTPVAANDPSNKLDFMFKDLQTSEFLRQSQQAAAKIQSYLEEVQDGGNKGVKQANFAVLTTARRPSVLIEMGYATNREDAALMTTRDGQRKLAASIANAIVAALRQYDKESGPAAGGPP
jgi:N-acetylmuramoyl-L-alanine amidase